MPLKAKSSLGILFSFVGLYLLFSWGGSGAAPSVKGPSYRLHNSSSPLPSTEFAIATFLTGQGKDDAYFTATRILTYQLLHAPDTRLNTGSITFLVVCSPSLPDSRKRRLKQDGAVVVEVDDVPRWKEVFTKLRIFEMTEYKRILFIDADTIITAPLDDIFKSPEVASLAPTLFSRKDQIKKDESPLPAEWFFGARSDNALTGQRQHPVPPLQSPSFSSGFFMIAPDRQIYAHLLSVMSHYRRFDPFVMEQNLLNYVYRRDGPMPWRELDWKWSATWPTEKDAQMGVASLHEKLWDRGPQPLRDMWDKRKKEMLQFYEAE
ncbi:glycosyltransferase family 8 protein [Trematosphaeria pertusa]|uniref:Glycosyltransferase family 8 protein n=1 Tax=Trematosphaeria pertusa TaxID=390896 RepID=A0A6A6IC16_9PLEO|nr:glycosyltransferase family 8 protein [Trematosphaeria pertusa]KAF2248115.1 glycosyltransferase family 8 protein [Trematosphaeria pertusa]